VKCIHSNCELDFGWYFDLGHRRQRSVIISRPRVESPVLFCYTARNRSDSAMKIIFYQANFCAECGNAMKPRLSFVPRYFCDECSAQMSVRNLFKPAAALLLCLTIVIFAINRTRQQEPNAPPTVRRSISDDSASPVQARDTLTKRNPIPNPPPVEHAICGARTKKGTPCRHLVSPGERCAQHRGMASMLEPASSEHASAKDPKPGR